MELYSFELSYFVLWGMVPEGFSGDLNSAAYSLAFRGIESSSIGLSVFFCEQFHHQLEGANPISDAAVKINYGPSVT